MDKCPKCKETKYDMQQGCKNCGYDWEDELELQREKMEYDLSPGSSSKHSDEE